MSNLSSHTPNIESEVSNPLQSDPSQNYFKNQISSSNQSNSQSQSQSQSHTITSSSYNSNSQLYTSSFRSQIPGSEHFYSLLESALFNNLEEIKQILEENQEVDLKNCSDSNGNNLLHRATTVKNPEMLEFFVNYAYQYETKYFDKNEARKKLIPWINQANKQELHTPVHLAAFLGQLEIMEILDSYGADFKCKNVKKQGPLHLAVYGEQPKSIVYLLNREDIDINQIDDKQSTALHWACYKGFENEVNYLVSYGDLDLNIEDESGYTPLHLAVMSGYSRVVKKLLIRGSDREAKNKNGETPMEIAEQNNFINIKKMLKLNPCTFNEYCNIQPAFKPVKYRLRQVLMFLGMYWIALLIYVYFQFPYFGEKYFYGSYIVAGSTFLAMFFFVVVWLQNPGYLKAKKKDRNTKNLLQLLEETQPGQICPDCFIVKPERSRHCEICKSCVMVYDHHCPWINNCVGAKNHFFFMLFIIAIWINLAIMIFFMVFTYIMGEYPDYNPYFPWFNENYKPEGWVKDVVFGILLLFVLLFEIPLTFLIAVQINNVLMNKTTFERYNHHVLQQQNQTQISNDPSQFDTASQSLISNQDSQFQQTFNDQNHDQTLEVERDCSNCGIMCFKNRRNPDYTYMQEFRRISNDSKVQSLGHENSIINQVPSSE